MARGTYLRNVVGLVSLCGDDDHQESIVVDEAAFQGGDVMDFCSDGREEIMILCAG